MKHTLSRLPASGDNPTIQGELERAIERLTGERIRVKGAGRTDAECMRRRRSWHSTRHPSTRPKPFVSALNHYLLDDIAVKAAYIVRHDFDPRRHARSRAYRYHHPERQDAIAIEKAVRLPHPGAAGCGTDA